MLLVTFPVKILIIGNRKRCAASERRPGLARFPAHSGVMEDKTNQDEDVCVGVTHETDIYPDDSETWASNLDMLPPELHCMIAEHVVAGGFTSACMLTQVTRLTRWIRPYIAT